MNLIKKYATRALAAVLFFATAAAAHDHHFVVVVASYNNEQWCRGNLESLFAQTYTNWHLIYTNDASTDKTDELVRAYVAERGMEHKTTYILNQTRCRQLANQYRAIHTCDDSSIICILDGDDRFAHPGVLERLNKEYQDPQVWLTYGSFKTTHPGYITPCKTVPASVVQNNSIRSYRWCLSLLRTFRAGLYKKIHKEDLMLNGDFFVACSDVATMIPMFEMAHGRYKYITEVLCIYNNGNSLNIHKQSTIQSKLSRIIRGRKRYAPLASLDPSEPARYETKSIITRCWEYLQDMSVMHAIKRTVRF